jgi:RHS repeat-associated protein
VRGIKLVAAILGLLLLIGSGIALAAGEGSSSDPSRPTALSESPGAPPGPELLNKRTATSETFRLPSGALQTRIYENPIFYRDAQGQWQPIRDRLEEADSGGLTNGPNRFDVSLPEHLGEDPVRISSGGQWVSAELLGPDSEAARLEGKTASYELPGGGTSFEFAGLANGLKEDIEIADPSQPSSFTFALHAADGLTPSLAEDGSIAFRSADGQVAFSLPAPLISDSSSGPRSTSGAVHYRLEPGAQGEWLLRIEADREWLESPDRVWPARIDPTLIQGSPSLDCVYAGAVGLDIFTGCGFGGQPELFAIYHPAVINEPDTWARSLLKFDLSSIPSNAYVASATVGLHAQSAVKNTVGVQLRRATKDWTSGVTWRKYDGGKFWSAEGGDFDATGSEVWTGERGGQAGWWNFNMIDLTRRWVAGSIPNQGLLLKLIDDKVRECSGNTCTERKASFDSSGAAESANRPVMTVEYFPPASSDSKLTSPQEGTRSAKRFKLQAAWTHAGVTGVKFQYKAPEGWTDVPASKVTDKNGNTVQWPIATEGAHESPAVYWNALETTVPLQVLKGQIRAVLFGEPGAAGFTEAASVELNKLGGAKDATASVGPGSLDLLTGNLTVSRTDVSIPGFGSSLEFSRTFASREAATSTAGVLGQGWKPGAPVEAAGGAAWRSVRDILPSEEEEEEGIGEYALLTDLEGYEYAFEFQNGVFVSPPEASSWVLARQESNFVFTDPGGNRTTFSNGAGGNEYLPVSVSQTGGPGNQTQMVYQLVNGARRLSMMIAPAADGITCTEANATTTIGCHSLTFSYQSEPTWGGDRLASITYHAAVDSSTMGQWEVAKYSYEGSGRLVAEWDPRISPALKETYIYEGSGRLQFITPPGEEPWMLEYGTFEEPHPEGRLISVKRASLASPSVAQTTIAYGVPLSDAGAPYDMSSSAVGQWGQQDLPADATAIFPPDQVPTNPPSSYSRATLYYLDVEGQLVNRATPLGAGTLAPSITTSEGDEHGNVIRELSAQNRLRALAAGSGSIAKSHELETKRVYNADGTEMQQEWGPLHQVRLESGSVTQARLHKVVQYDEGWPGTGIKPHLPTRETTGANIPGEGEDADQRVTETHYDWPLRKPTETIVDPGSGHLNIVSKTAYDSISGLPTEIRQPSNATAAGAATTKIIYYKAKMPTTCPSSALANLPCEILPAAQPGTPGQPELLVKRFASYSPLGKPTEVIDSPGGGTSNTRKTILTYDSAGRPITKQQEGGGTAIPKTEVFYSPTLGLQTRQRLVCESECISLNYSSSFGAAGTGNGQFNHPADVVADGKGNVWVVDKANNRIEEFNEKGEFVRAAGSFGSAGGQLNSPSAIAIDTWGNLDVADTGNSRIARFSETGAFVSVVGASVNKTRAKKGTLAEKNHCTAESGDVCQAGTAGSSEGQMNQPVGVATSSGDGGNFYVVEKANNRVEKFNLQGELLAKFGSLGSGGGQLKEPTAITIAPNGYLWVADTGNNRIEEWNSSLGYVRQVGSEGSGNGQFKHPDALDTDAEGNVFVVDQNNARVEGFSSSGEYLRKFGSGGSGPGQFSFSEPVGLAVSGANIWITDPGNNRVQKWTANGFDDQAVTTTYDALGRVTTYEDADGNKATTTYDLLGRPVTTNDGKGTQTRVYDPTSGLLTELQDSAAGNFTASYDADGNMVERGLPDGLVAKTTYDEIGAPASLTYTKSSNCGASCTWLSFGAEHSIYGQVLSQTSTLSSQVYSYDKAGRLTLVKDTPQGGSCTTRSYSYDIDSNRKTLITRAPGLGGVCDTTSEGTTQSHSYDTADRLIDTGIVYDNFGRITSLPGADAGGSTLTTSFFSNDMIASQSQGGVTNTFQLDGALRQRQRLQAGGLEGTEVFHYANPSDSPVWTERGSVWSRNIVGIGGELAAIQNSSSGTLLQLTNLHGDVVATASPSPSATELASTSEYDEFGNPEKGSPARFGWLGGKQRRTELASGVIQMGVRSYVPAIGRFLTLDPVPGGSANAYDYANQDPVNNFDLTGECYVTIRPSPGRCKKRDMTPAAAASRANDRGAIVTKFNSKRGAERFLHYLESNPLYVENLQKQEAQWKASELRNLQQRAAREAAVNARFDEESNAHACGWMAWGSGVAGLALAPVSGGASFVVGILGVGTGLGDLTDTC